MDIIIISLEVYYEQDMRNLTYILKKKTPQPMVGIQQIMVIEFETNLQINQDFI